MTPQMKLLMKLLMKPQMKLHNKGITMKSVLSLLAVCLVCSTAAADLNTTALERAMANSARPAADKERDASRQAPAVLNFLGLEAGMTVLDVNASTGWYTEVLSYAVGPNGRVYMQNRPGGNSEEAATARANRLSNVQQIGAISDAPAGSVDFAITALNLHDFHNSNPAVAQGILAEIVAALKHGGILGIIDHEGTSGADNASLHRIAFDEAVKAALQSGDLALVGASDILDNPADDHTVAPFNPSLERNTDRIVLKFIKL
jgi:predicted methyltransferase